MKNSTDELRKLRSDLLVLKEEKQRRTAPTVEHIRRDPAAIFSFAGKTADPWQTALLRGDAHRMLLNCCRQSGKSTTAAALSLKVALLNTSALVLLLSPTLRQSGELFRDKVMRLYRSMPALGGDEAIVQESALQATFANGSRIISLPGDEETIRGYSGVALLVIDEASRVPDDLYRSVRPMLAVSGGRLVCMSTPFGKQGWFHDEWFGPADWVRVRIPADQVPRISPEFLAEEMRALGAEWFAQEYLCEFTDATGTPMFPGAWLDLAASVAAKLSTSGVQRRAIAIGIDPAEGGDRTAMCAVDTLGVVELVSKQTPDTSVITGEVIAFMRKHGVPAERVCIDRGGGGKEHADRLRSQGYEVRTVAFGEAVAAEPRRGMAPFSDRVDVREDRGAFKNRRAEMYWTLRVLLDPTGNPKGFAIPAEYGELRRQLSPIPLEFDGEGRVELRPKNRRETASGGAVRKSLVELIGHSPDEADALALAVHAMTARAARPVAGAYRTR